MNYSGARELIEKALKHGYIDYSSAKELNNYISLYYKGYEIWPARTTANIFIIEDGAPVYWFSSENLNNKLKTVIKAWEAI